MSEQCHSAAKKAETRLQDMRCYTSLSMGKTTGAVLCQALSFKKKKKINNNKKNNTKKHGSLGKNSTESKKIQTTRCVKRNWNNRRRMDGDLSI